MKTLLEIEVTDKTVLMQGNLDVPLDEEGIEDDARIRADLETLQFLLSRGCRILLAGHIGRPKGNDPALSTRIVADHLQTLVDVPVEHVNAVTGKPVEEAVARMKPASILVLENMRYDPRQQAGDETLARELAQLADVFVNNDYIDAHRANALNVHMPKLLPSCAGFTLQREYRFISDLIEHAQQPFVLIIGGAKADKIGVINHLLGSVDHIIVGGVLANTFLKAAGHDIKTSKFDERSLEIAGEFLRDEEEKFLLPVDVVAASKFSEDASYQEVSVDEVPENHMILDIGTHTAERYRHVLMDAKTIIWGGPIGVFEWDAFARGTHAVAQAVAESGATSLVAGGDSGAAIHKLGLTDKVGHVSIGGGATLSLIGGSELPAIKGLEEAQQRS